MADKPDYVMNYPKLNPADLEPYYYAHVNGMTAQRLHAKADIAVQLAWRDQRIDLLVQALEQFLKIAEQQGVDAGSMRDLLKMPLSPEFVRAKAEDDDN